MTDLGQYAMWVWESQGPGPMYRWAFGPAPSGDPRPDPMLRATNMKTGKVLSMRLYGATDYVPDAYPKGTIQFGAFNHPDDGGGFNLYLPAELAERIFQLDPKMRSWNGFARNQPK